LKGKLRTPIEKFSSKCFARLKKPATLQLETLMKPGPEDHLSKECYYPRMKPKEL